MLMTLHSMRSANILLLQASAKLFKDNLYVIIVTVGEGSPIHDSKALLYNL